MQWDKINTESAVGTARGISNEEAPGEKSTFPPHLWPHIFNIFIYIVPCQGDELLYYSQDYG